MLVVEYEDSSASNITPRCFTDVAGVIRWSLIRKLGYLIINFCFNLSPSYLY